MKNPVVTVICTCFNHANYVGQAIDSVFGQSYDNIQLIVIDNNSTDGSATVIQNKINAQNPFLFIQNDSNVGLCKAFNQGLAKAKGEFVIDLAADDVLMPDRIAKQVEAFEKLPDDYAVVFSNATYINKNNQLLGYHYPINKTGLAKIKVVDGDVYAEILRHYYICTPTMMMRKSALDALGGYDEQLTYEDFDFFVRSSHRYKYFYLDQVLTQKRMTDNSLSSQFYKIDNKLLESSWQVCNKAYDLNRNEEEYKLLATRIRSFIKKCVVAQNPQQATKFRTLLTYIEDPGWQTNFWVYFCRLGLPVNFFYRCYNQWRNYRY
jgi:glycosyltransferase involved in cell wall biosynthesis